MEKHFLPQSNGSTSGFLHAVLLALYYVPTEACCCFTALQCKGKGLLCVSLGKNLLWWPWKHFLQADPMEILVYQVRCEQSSNPLQTMMNGLFLTRRSARQVAKHCEHCGFCIMLRFMALQCTETSAKAWWFLLALTDAAELTPNTTLLQAWPKRSVLSSAIQMQLNLQAGEQDEPLPSQRYAAPSLCPLAAFFEPSFKKYSSIESTTKHHWSTLAL